jgi:hypothetical protein
MIHKTHLGYVISASQVWLPGLYADERAAKYAFRFPDEALVELQGNDPSRAITFEELQEFQRELKQRVTC